MEKQGFKQLVKKLDPRHGIAGRKYFSIILLCDNTVQLLKRYKVKLVIVKQFIYIFT